MDFFITAQPVFFPCRTLNVALGAENRAYVETNDQHFTAAQIHCTSCVTLKSTAVGWAQNYSTATVAACRRWSC